MAIYIVGSPVAPPPPTPPGDEVVFSLLGTQTTTQPFTFLQTFREGDVPPNSYVTAQGLATFQSSILNRWPDGSARDVVIAGRGALTANVPRQLTLQSVGGTQPGSPLTEAQLITFNPQVTVTFTGGVSATVTLASLLGQVSTGAHTSNGLVRTHITGPQMSEFHYRSQVGSDLNLSVWFYVRFYGDDAEIEIKVKNSRLFGTLAQKSYTFTINVNGTQRFSLAASHWARANFTTCHWYNTGTDGYLDYFRVIPQHNAPYFKATGVVPMCAFPGPINANTFAIWGTGQPQLNGGPYGSTDFSGGGFQDFIGLLLNSDCGHLVTPTAQTYAAMIRGQLALQSWPVDTTDETTGSPGLPSTYPAGVFPNNSGWGGGTPFAEPSNSTSPYTWLVGDGETNAHMPCAGYFAYKVTGRWHFAEDCAHWAIRGFYDSNPSARSTLAQWLLAGGRFQERAKAWMVRQAALAASCYPDNPPRAVDASLRADLLTIVGQNYVYWAANGIGTALGVNKDGYRISPPQDFRWQNNTGNYGPNDLPGDAWQENMRVAVTGWIWDLRLPLTDAQREALRRVRDDWYQFPVGMTGDGNNFCFRFGGLTRTVFASFSGSVVTVLPSWKAVYDREVAVGNFPAGASCTLTDAWNGDSSMQGNHALRLPALAYAVKHGAPGAAEALNRMQSSSTWTTLSQCLASSNGSNPMMWYVKPEPAPAWFAALPSLQWSAQAIDNDIAAVNPNLPNLPMPPGSPAAGVLDFMTSWCSAFYDDDRKDYGHHSSGGHANHWGNHGFAVNIMRAVLRWRRYCDSTPAGSAGNPEATGSTFADGRGRAMHNTFCTFINGKIIFPVQNSVTSGGGGSVKVTASFNKEKLGFSSVPTPYAATAGYPMSGVNLWGFHGDPFPSNPNMLDAGKFGVCARDRSTGVVWSIGGDTENNAPWWSVNTVGGVITPRTHGNLPFSNFGMIRACVVIPMPDVHLFVIFSGLTNEIAFLDLNNEGLGFAKAASVTGSLPTFASLGSFNIPNNMIWAGCYERTRQIILFDPRRLGSTLWALAPPRNANGSFNRTGAWAVGIRNLPAVSFVNDGGHGSTYQKPQIEQEMGDGRGTIIFCDSINGPTYFCPLPKDGV